MNGIHEKKISGQDKVAVGSMPKGRQYTDTEDVTPHSAPHSSYMFSSPRSQYAQGDMFFFSI